MSDTVSESQDAVLVVDGKTNGLGVFSSEMRLLTHGTRSSFCDGSLSLISIIAGNSHEKRHHTQILLAPAVTWRVVKKMSNFHSHKIS